MENIFMGEQEEKFENCDNNSNGKLNFKQQGRYNVRRTETHSQLDIYIIICIEHTFVKYKNIFMEHSAISKQQEKS